MMTDDKTGEDEKLLGASELETLQRVKDWCEETGHPYDHEVAMDTVKICEELYALERCNAINTDEIDNINKP
jgi:hypothetical protein